MTRQFFSRLLILHIGLFLYSLGIALSLNAQIGYAPWEVLHVGMAKTFGMTIGEVSIIVGFLILLVTAYCGEDIGIGTIANMIVIGLVLDLILYLDFLPVADNMFSGLLMLITGLFTIALGSYFYIASAFGAGPRDGLMVLLTRKTGLPIGLCRGGIELAAVVIGWFLGGLVGIGTVVSALMIGFCVQITFKLLRFDPTKIHHERLQETYKSFRQK
ncbi:MAG: YitT family protein [Acidaminococcaceae bacterium]